MSTASRAALGLARFTACLAIAFAAAQPTPAAAAPAECEAWPGEPTPLPSTTDPDTRSARWAELRAEEIAVRAQLAEPDDPMESLRLWRRVLCLDPSSSPAWNGIARTQPVRIHQPNARWGGRRAASVRDPWAQLAMEIRVPTPRARPQLSEATRAVLAEAEEQLTQGEAQLAEARFREALGRAQAAREMLAEVNADVAAGKQLRARAEVAAATAHVALGDAGAARESFTRALAANPRLQLDPKQTSPKVLEVLEAARSGGGGTP
jgi:tetratricopeptide (TPR) repeat protein